MNKLLDPTRSYAVETVLRDQIMDLVKSNASLSKGELLTKIKTQFTGNTRLGPDVKSEYLFHSQFPFPATADKITNDKFARILLNSTGKAKGYNDATSSKVKYAVLGSVGVGVLWMLVTIISTMSNPTIMSVDEAAPEEVQTRQKARGQLASLITALTFSLVINATIDATGKVSSATSTALVGMTLGGTIGFLLDSCIGSEEGYAKTKESLGKGVRHAFSSMGGPQYGRYIVTVLFDMFFTVILFKPIFLKLLSLPFLGDSDFGGSLANGLTSTLISVTTFYCYANLTRFQWAYPSKAAGKDSWIQGNQIVLVVAVMAVVYLISNTQLFPGESGVNDPDTKLYIVMGSMLLLGGLMSYGVIDQRDDDDDNVDDESGWARGLAIFTAVLFVTILGTYSTSVHETIAMKWGVPMGIIAGMFALALIMCNLS